VLEGAYFEICKGRSIKSQVTGNAISGPVIVRNAYNGVVEIDCQYSGGYVVGAQVFYDNVSVEAVISGVTRVGLPRSFTMRDNVLTIKNPPATNTGTMCFLWGVDNTNGITQDCSIFSGNKVLGGAVNYMVTAYGANVVDTNRIVVRDNHADTVATAFFALRVVFDNPAQMNIVFEGNSCKSGCVGSDIVSSGRLVVESDRANHKIQSLAVTPIAISAGVLPIYAGSLQLVANEGGAGFDDVVTISGGGYSSGDLVVFKKAFSAQSPTFKNGTGNIFLAGSDFELNSVRDRLVLSYDAGSNEWHEVSRSDNGA
jgi:hypothetical protein